MRFSTAVVNTWGAVALLIAVILAQDLQIPFAASDINDDLDINSHHGGDGDLSPSRSVPVALSAELEELARIVDIAYCVTLTGLGLSKPFTCLSRCTEFPHFELVRAWNTGPLLSDSCGYIALDHEKHRLIVAFRGTYSLTNTLVDLSTVPQKYVPYPGDDDVGDDDGKEQAPGEELPAGTSSLLKRNASSPIPADECANCTVHMGFHASWRNTRDDILPDILTQRFFFPNYTLHLVGHSLGGAVATLGALDFHARGWNPVVTTFGAPRVGNAALAAFIDAEFGLLQQRSIHDNASDDTLHIQPHTPHAPFRRVTHVDDPVPLLPLTEWGFAMHAGEIFISKPALAPDTSDLQLCVGDADLACIAGQDASVSQDVGDSVETPMIEVEADSERTVDFERPELTTDAAAANILARGLIPSRLKLWQLLFAHRDYFRRLGLCVPGGDPFGIGKD